MELRIKYYILQSTRQRFIDTIDFIYKHLNPPEQNQQLKGTELKYSINDLSEMVGTSKKSLGKLIEEFKSNNLLHVQDDNIIIHGIGKFLST